MPLENPYCTVAQVQEELRNRDESLVPVIEEAINHASRFIDSVLGYDFYQHDHTTNPIKIYGCSRWAVADMIWIPYLHIQRIDKVVWQEEEQVPGEDYVLVGRRLIRVDELEWLGDDKTDCVEIYGLFGWPQTASTDVPKGMPQEITRACIMIAAAFTGHNQKEIVGPDGSVMHITNKEIPKAAWDIIGQRRPLIP